MLKKDLLGEPEVWALMCARFPWVIEERGDIGEGLVHLEFATLRRGVERAADRGDREVALEILTFVEELLTKITKLHPDVINAIEVSFIEDLYLSERYQVDFAAPLLPPKTRAYWDRTVAAYERGSTGS